MERIVIEVAKTTAKKWRESSHPKRKKIATLLAKALKEDPTSKALVSKKDAAIKASINESSLAKEWLSEEDNRWDDLLK